MSYGSKIDPNVTNRRHQLPLHYACLENGQLLSLENRIDIVKILVPLTVHTNKKDMFEKTPLDYARENGFTEIVKILSEKLMDNFLNKVCNHPNTLDLNGRLPLHKVCMNNSLNFELNIGGRLELVKILMILTLDINCQDNLGNTALHYASENGFHELVKMLAKKCDTKIENKSGKHR